MKKIIILLGIIAMTSCHKIAPETRVLAKTANDSVLVVAIPKAGCHNCQKVVEGGLANFKGVKQTILNLHTKEVSVLYNPNDINSNTLTKKVHSLADNIPCK